MKSNDESKLKAKLCPLPPEKVREILFEVDAFFDEHPEFNLPSPEGFQSFAHRLLMSEWVRNLLAESNVELSEEQTSNCVHNLCEGLTPAILRDPERLSEHLDSALAPNGIVFTRGKWRKAYCA